MAWAMILKGISTGMQVQGMYQQGKSGEEAAKFTSDQLKRNALAIEAKGQRSAKSERDTGALVKSSAKAQMAAGGGGVDTELLADIDTKADYNALAALYESKTQADNIRDEAKLTRWQGRTANKQGRLGAFSTALGGASSAMASKGK